MKISVLTAALLTAVMSENGKSIEALKEKNRSLEEEAAGLRLRLSEQDSPSFRKSVAFFQNWKKTKNVFQSSETR